jgi:hypothetical protein
VRTSPLQASLFVFSTDGGRPVRGRRLPHGAGHHRGRRPAQCFGASSAPRAMPAARAERPLFTPATCADFMGCSPPDQPLFTPYLRVTAGALPCQILGLERGLGFLDRPRIAEPVCRTDPC